MTEQDLRKIITDNFGQLLEQHGFKARDSSQKDDAFMLWVNGMELFLFTWPEGLSSLTVEYQKADAAEIEEPEEPSEENEDEAEQALEEAPGPAERLQFVRETLESMLDIVGSRKSQ